MLISFPFWTPNDFNAQKPKCPPHQKSLQPKESNILKEKGDVSLLLMVTIIRWNEISSCFNTMREYGVLGHLCHLRVCVCVATHRNLNHIPGKPLAQMWPSCNFHFAHGCCTVGPPPKTKCC